MYDFIFIKCSDQCQKVWTTLVNLISAGSEILFGLILACSCIHSELKTIIEPKRDTEAIVSRLLLCVIYVQFYAVFHYVSSFLVLCIAASQS